MNLISSENNSMANDLAFMQNKLPIQSCTSKLSYAPCNQKDTCRYHAAQTLYRHHAAQTFHTPIMVAAQPMLNEHQPQWLSIGGCNPIVFLWGLLSMQWRFGVSLLRLVLI